MTFSGGKQLRPCPTSARAASEEDGSHELLQETTTLFAEFFLQGTVVYFFEVR